MNKRILLVEDDILRAVDAANAEWAMEIL